MPSPHHISFERVHIYKMRRDKDLASLDIREREKENCDKAIAIYFYYFPYQKKRRKLDLLGGNLILNFNSNFIRAV